MSERDDLLRAIEAHMAEMDARALAPGRDRDDIDNDLYNVATRIRDASGPAPDRLPLTKESVVEWLASDAAFEAIHGDHHRADIQDKLIAAFGDDR